MKYECYVCNDLSRELLHTKENTLYSVLETIKYLLIYDFNNYNKSMTHNIYYLIIVTDPDDEDFLKTCDIHDIWELLIIENLYTKMALERGKFI